MEKFVNFFCLLCTKITIYCIIVYFGVLRPQTPDPLLSASNKSGQKCLSAHFTISKNTSLRSVLVKFEAEPNYLKSENFDGHVYYFK